MAKKDNTRKNIKEANYDKGVVKQNIGDTCTNYMQIFGANTNLMRHIPTMCDGLKPGERRILYVMYLMGLKPNADRTKVNDIVGRVALYHPHGDASPAGTVVKLGQAWNNIQKFIDGKGNFGSIAGDPPAAARYIEARLSFYSWKCFFEEYSDDIIDTKMNYLGTKVEPEFLPAKYPNGLINNSFGIGFGNFAGIPTYNFKEVCEATINLIEDEDYDVILVPDTPYPTYVVDEGQIPTICRQGFGKFKSRGIIDIDPETNTLHIRSCPMLTDWNVIKASIIKLLTDGKSSQIKSVKEYSDDGFDCQLKLKKEADPYAIRDMIYSKTQMQKTVSVAFKFIDDYEDNLYTLKEYLQNWIDFRRETKRRYYAHRLSVLKTREHLLDVVLLIINKDNAERTAAIFKKSPNVVAAVTELVKTYGITSMQAKYVADLGFGALTKEAFAKYSKERDAVREEGAKVDKILRSRKKIDKIIIDELNEGIKLFGSDRNTKLITIDNEVKIRNTDHVVVVTSDGYIKKLGENISDVGYIHPGAYPTEVIKINNTADILIFDSTGKVHKIPVHKITGTPLSGEGIKLSTLCGISGNVVSMKKAPSKDTDVDYLVMVTRNGFIKKTVSSAYRTTKSSLYAITLKADDELVCCKTVNGDSDVIIYTTKGRAIRFNSSSVRDTGRTSVGVNAMTLDKDEYVLGLVVVSAKDKYVFVITNDGRCKKCTLSTFVTMERNTKPLVLTSLDAGDSINTVLSVKGKETLQVYRKLGIDILDMKDVPEMTRLSKGKKLVKVVKTDNIITVK